MTWGELAKTVVTICPARRNSTFYTYFVSSRHVPPFFLLLAALDLVLNQIAMEDLPCLYHLALVSKNCHAITDRRRFHHLHFTVVSRKRLDQDYQPWIGIL